VTVIDADDPLAMAAADAIHAGDVGTLGRLLEDHPELVAIRLGSSDPTCGMTRTLLHVVTDWPGHFPNGADTVRLLVGAGADPNARFEGPHRETPLHWAASSDDVAVLDALLDAGADIDADGAVIADGTPLTDATAFGQWNAAGRLLERGARAGAWESAVMGLVDRLHAALDADQPTQATVNGLFWGACHGGHIPTAEVALAHGADVNWVGWDELTPLGAAERSGWADVVAWLRERGAG
jgi:hypothetical protein